jgi:hypothetical protein
LVGVWVAVDYCHCGIGIYLGKCRTLLTVTPQYAN